MTSIACIQLGEAMWQCTSILRGLAWANAIGAATVAATADAAAPPRKLRRLTAGEVNDGGQHRQVEIRMTFLPMP
jgi:hypothetical protein